LSQWALPTNYGACGVKVDKHNVYITVYDRHQIFVYNKTGVLEKKFGQKLEGSNEGQFHQPEGITIDECFIYICDSLNHRIQVLWKEEGDFSHQWGSEGAGKGQFRCPFSIHLSEGVIFVGDYMSVQLFTPYGVFFTKIRN